LLVRSPAAAEYASGHLLYLREHTLMAQRFDPDELDLDGEAFPIVDSVALINVATAQAVFSASSNGVLAYQGGELSEEKILRWRSRDGKLLEDIGDPAQFEDFVELSPTGDTAAVEIREGEGENIDVWIVELDRRLKTRFSFDPEQEGAALFSPDGQSLIWMRDAPKGTSLHRKAIGGSGEGELVAAFEFLTWPVAWHPSGETLLIGQRVSVSPVDYNLLSFSLDRPDEIRPWLDSEFIEYGGSFSPDGRWFVYGTNESGQWEVYVAPYPGPGRKWQISVGGGGWPRWRGDGEEILYVDAAGNLAGVAVEARGAGLAFGEPQILFQHRIADNWSYDVTADGTRFIVTEPSKDTTPEPVTVVVNWPAAVEAER
jgi:hypothetical protein